MKTICLYFEIHQIIHLKRYRCFDIGRDHYYYDDYENERGISDIAERSYIPALSALIEMAKNHGDTFKVALSISGVALEQLEVHAPGVIELLHQLNETGCCEFLCEPYSHGLSSLANEDCFREEVERMRTKIKQIFGKEPKVFRNSSLIYSNDIGATIADMGFKGMLTEGAKHILGWKSPHYLYHCAMNPNLKLLLRDFKLSDDISLRFSNSEWNEYPLFADKYIDWIAALPEEDQYFHGTFCFGYRPAIVFQYFGIYESTACLRKRKRGYFLYSDRYHYQTEICGSGGCSLSYVMDRRGTRYQSVVRQCDAA